MNITSDLATSPIARQPTCFEKLAVKAIDLDNRLTFFSIFRMMCRSLLNPNTLPGSTVRVNWLLQFVGLNSTHSLLQVNRLLRKKTQPPRSWAGPRSQLVSASVLYAILFHMVAGFVVAPGLIWVASTAAKAVIFRMPRTVALCVRM